MQPELIVHAKPVGVVDHQVLDLLPLALGAAGHRRRPHPRGRVRGPLLLEEVLARDAVGVAHERDRAVAQVRQEHVRDLPVVRDQAALGDLLVGEEDLVQIRELELAGRLHGLLLHEALEHGRAQPALARPFGELHFTRQQRLDPRDAGPGRAGRPRRAA